MPMFRPRPMICAISRPICGIGDWTRRFEAAAEIVGAEGFGGAVGPDFYAAVGDQFEREVFAGGFADDFGQRIGIAVRPFDVDVDADQFFLRGRRLRLWFWWPVAEDSPRILRLSEFAGSWPRRATTASANSLVPTFCLLVSSLKMS